MSGNYIDPGPEAQQQDPSLNDQPQYVAGLTETADRLARRPWPTRPLRPDIVLSFEFFPTVKPRATEDLVGCARRLGEINPRFVSVTYGAGGSTQERTFVTIDRLQSALTCPVAGHLTVVGATKAETTAAIDRYLDMGVRHIVALRGDPPSGSANGSGLGTGSNGPGFETAAELVGAIRTRADERGLRGNDHVKISVAAYPEVHPKAVSAQADMDNLKRKIDAGADQAITQFFFDNSDYLRFVDSCRAAGITAPVVAGIMPVTSFSRVANFASRCGAAIPAWMSDLYRGLDDAPDVHQLVSVTVAAEQCRELAEHGVRHFHFYTMNRPELSLAICRVLGFDTRSTTSASATTGATSDVEEVVALPPTSAGLIA